METTTVRPRFRARALDELKSEPFYQAVRGAIYGLNYIFSNGSLWRVAGFACSSFRGPLYGLALRSERAPVSDGWKTLKCGSWLSLFLSLPRCIFAIFGITMPNCHEQTKCSRSFVLSNVLVLSATVVSSNRRGTRIKYPLKRIYVFSLSFLDFLSLVMEIPGWRLERVYEARRNLELL